MVLVSTLDSTIRLMDKGNGQMLQCYKGHTNTNFRIRSCLGMADSVVISGSEDGHIYAWDLLEGKIIDKLGAQDGKVASAVAFSGAKKEWASAGVDGEHLAYLDEDWDLTTHRERVGVGNALNHDILAFCTIPTTKTIPAGECRVSVETLQYRSTRVHPYSIDITKTY